MVVLSEAEFLPCGFGVAAEVVGITEGIHFVLDPVLSFELAEFLAELWV